MNVTTPEKQPLVNLRRDGGTQPRAQMDLFIVDEYAEAMSEGAVFPAIVVFFDGTDYWLADGFHRYDAAIKARVDLAQDVRQGTRRDAVLYSIGANASHGLRRTNEDKRRAVLKLLEDEEWGRWSDSEIARRAGVSHTHVRDVRISLATVASDNGGRTYVDRWGNERVMGTRNIGGSTEIPLEVVDPNEQRHVFPTPPRGDGEDDLDNWDDDKPMDPREYATEDRVYKAGMEALEEQYERDLAEYEGRPEPEEELPARPHVANNSGNNEWYTPSEYLEAARKVMGGIDLDPASSAIANERVQADVFYTAENDGLNHAWGGRVWMNPPYASELIGKFCDRLAQHYEDELVTEAIVLVNNATETQWFQRLADLSSCIAFPRRRVRFLDPQGNPSGAPLQGQAVIYLGPKAEHFAATFSEMGFTR